MKKILTLTASLLALSASAQNVYEINAPEKPKTIYEGRLKLGGVNPDGERIDVNSFYMSVAGKPFLPVMGEFHYVRYPEAQWEEEIMKMKAGGINVLPSYVFWSLHEPYEGEFDWSGNRNLRRFVELCVKHDMKVIVRIGPFGHGEIRSGGLPDWLFAKNLEVRCDHPLYLKYVKRLYHEIAQQLTGLYYKDGGPIIGCQIENEMQHSAAPWAICYPKEPKDHTAATQDQGTIKIGVSVQDKRQAHQAEGDMHMVTLKRMAEEEGIITPIYTATAWGNAAVIGNEAIPVTAAYTYPTWASKPTMSPFCMFKDMQKNPDYPPIRYDGEQFPSFAAEMGVGIQMTYDSRPNITAEAAEALMVRCLGSGSNGIGYYMYHGGSTPMRIDNIGFYSDEPMGVPKISYDFQAPIGEFGLEGKSFRPLRLLHSFIADFGDRLAPMETILPENAATMTPGNHDQLRYAARMKDDSGFIFMVNFQDHDTLREDMTDIQLKLNLKGETLLIPSPSAVDGKPSRGFTLPKDHSLILPFNFSMDDALMKYSTTQLLMKIDDGGLDHYFFFALDGVEPEYLFDKTTVSGKSLFRPVAGRNSTFVVRSKAGRRIKVTTLTREDALDACKVGGRLLITKAQVMATDSEISLLSLGDNEFRYTIFPSKTGMKEQVATVEKVEPLATIDNASRRRMAVNFMPEEQPQVNEYFLHVDYIGDVAMAFLDNHLVQDHFYYGEPWQIGLKRHYKSLATQPMVLYFRPMRKDAPGLNLLPNWAKPDFSNSNAVCSVRSIQILPQYILTIK